MVFKLAFVLLSTLAHPAVFVGAGSTRLGRNEMDSHANSARAQIDEPASTHQSIEANVDPPIVKPVLRALNGGDGGSNWDHGTYSVAHHSGNLKLYVPSAAKTGDTLFLFLSRTDGLLPLKLDRWSRTAECFKNKNRQGSCLKADNCARRDGSFCHCDLGTVVFHRKVAAEDPGCWEIEIPGGSTTWAIVTAISDVNDGNPIIDTAGESCDVDWNSVFPPVYGRRDDILLLSQSFDDSAQKNNFQPPDGTMLLGWTRSYDEAAFLYGKKLEITGQTNQLVTKGRGGPKCKDALLSIVVNRN